MGAAATSGECMELSGESHRLRSASRAVEIEIGSTHHKAMQESYSAKCACITVAPAKSTDSKSVAD